MYCLLIRWWSLCWWSLCRWCGAWRTLSARRCAAWTARATLWCRWFVTWVFFTVMACIATYQVNILFFLFFPEVFPVELCCHPHHPPRDVLVFIGIAGEVPVLLGIIATNMTCAAFYA